MKKNFLFALLIINCFFLYFENTIIKDYLGKWKIDKVFSIDKDYFCLEDFTETDAQEFKNKTIEYSQNKIIINNDSVLIKKFDEFVFSNEELKEYTSGSIYEGYSFSDLGISNTNKIRFIAAQPMENLSTEFPFGCFFYQISKKDLLIHYRGYFFHAFRLTND